MGAYIPAPAGVSSPGVAPDGLKGQFLSKASDLDYDTEWVDIEIPAGTGTGSVTSVALSAPSGFSVAGSPVTGSGTLTLSYAAGYSLPSTASQGSWDTAFTLASSAVQPGALTSALASKADLVGGLVPSAQLPGFVDDVLEFANVAAFPAAGETGKLYISLATNRAYRWSGSIYVEINPSPGSTDGVPEGSVNLYFTTARGEAAAASWWASSAAASKLAGIATGATANASDAQLRDRNTHTGTQSASTISGGTLDAAVLPASGATAGTYGSSSLIPVLTVDAAGRVTAASTAAAASGSGRVRCDASAVTTIYVGRAAAGTAESATGWTITRTTYSALGVLQTTRTATGAWTNRASLTYS